MTTRIFIAGILGGIVMFIWSWIGHDLLPLGHAGISELPNEQAVRDAMTANLPTDGLYLFPMPKLDPNATFKERSDAMNEAMKKAAEGPSGLLMYHPTRKFDFAKLLGTEFGAEVVEALILVWLVAQIGISGFGRRVGFALVAGIFASLVTNIPYWNFYGFPTAYTAAYMSIQVVGFLLVGIMAALILPKRSAQPAA
jgi:hypothetical protein